MNKEQFKEYVCWLIDRDYLKHNNDCKGWIYNFMNEYIQETREQKINEILK